MPPVGFEPIFSAGERPQTYTFDRAATGAGDYCYYYIIIFIINIIIIFITFLQAVYNYIPEINHLFKVYIYIYSVAAVLYSQFVLHVMLIPL